MRKCSRISYESRVQHHGVELIRLGSTRSTTEGHLGWDLATCGAPGFTLLKQACEGIKSTPPLRCPSPSSVDVWSQARRRQSTNYVGDLEHVPWLFRRARPIQVREPARALQRLEHRTQQRHRRQVAFRGVAAEYGRGRRRGGKRPVATRLSVAAEAEAIPLALYNASAIAPFGLRWQLPAQRCCPATGRCIPLGGPARQPQWVRWRPGRGGLIGDGGLG